MPGAGLRNHFGLLCRQIGGRAIWTVPATFVTVMALGGLVGRADAGLGASIIENAIAASVILLGVVIAVERNLAIGLAMAVVGVVGMFHGYAHGGRPGDVRQAGRLHRQLRSAAEPEPAQDPAPGR